MVGLSVVLIFLPWLFFLLFRVGVKEIEQTKDVKVGYVKTLSGSVLEIHLMIGDVFAPRTTRRDIGFDLVPVSCFFDPININGEVVLLGNPLLNSAIRQSVSQKDSTEILYFLQNLVRALEQSREVVDCFSAGTNTYGCEGDQIVPFVWATYENSMMCRDQGVKYLAALPLFDPDVVMERYPPKEARERLAANLETSVRRLITHAMDNLASTVRSIGFAALGSTSHKAGDSEYFLEFSQGFLTILRALQTSRPPESLDRVYLVAFDSLTGKFRERGLIGLQTVSDYLLVSKLASPANSVMVGGICSVLFFFLGLLSYQQIGWLLRKKNRWELVTKVLPVSVAASALSWSFTVYLTTLLPPGKVKLCFYAYMIITVLCIGAVIWLSKWIPRYKRNPQI